jgi:hypothetical protein
MRGRRLDSLAAVAELDARAALGESGYRTPLQVQEILESQDDGVTWDITPTLRSGPYAGKRYLIERDSLDGARRVVSLYGTGSDKSSKLVVSIGTSGDHQIVEQSGSIVVDTVELRRLAGW